MSYNRYPYELPALPYPYNALMPYIDTETMHYHHDRHFQTYVDNLNAALKPYPVLQRLQLEQILRRGNLLPAEARTKILQNAGGVYNHMLFFEGLSPAAEGRHEPQGRLAELINKTFSSYQNFQKLFTDQAMEVFGSGWTCLAMTAQQQLKIVNLANQETTLAQNAVPLLLFDVWEHAYYLKYKNARADYLAQLWHVVRFLEFR